MKKLLPTLIVSLVFFQACIPLVVGGVVGYEVAKSKSEDNKKHEQLMEVEKQKLDLMKKQAEMEGDKRCNKGRK